MKIIFRADANSSIGMGHGGNENLIVGAAVSRDGGIFVDPARDSFILNPVDEDFNRHLKIYGGFAGADPLFGFLNLST